MVDVLAELRAGLAQEIALQGPIIPGASFVDHMRARVPKDSPLHQCHSLDEVAAFVRSHVLIPIDKHRTHAVPGAGNPHADLVFVGEAPGKQEDEQGLPFVGPAGKLLTKILKAIDLDRDEVFITNILKTRPPGNRNPEPEEIAKHLPILYQQLSLIQPKILCCLGKVAGNALLKCTEALGTMRQREHNFFGISLMVTYHPSALLRNPRWKRPTWEDVKVLRDRNRALQVLV